MSIFKKFNVAEAAREHAVDEIVEGLAQHGKKHFDGLGTIVWTGHGLRIISDEKLVNRIHNRQTELGTDICFPTMGEVEG